MPEEVRKKRVMVAANEWLEVWDACQYGGWLAVGAIGGPAHVAALDSLDMTSNPASPLPTQAAHRHRATGRFATRFIWHTGHL